MRSRAKTSLPILLDVVLALSLVAAVNLVSRALRTVLPAPEGTAWLWPVALIALAVTVGATRRRDLSVRACVLGCGIIAVGGQVIVQLVYACVR